MTTPQTDQQRIGRLERVVAKSLLLVQQQQRQIALLTGLFAEQRDVLDSILADDDDGEGWKNGVDHEHD